MNGVLELPFPMISQISFFPKYNLFLISSTNPLNRYLPTELILTNVIYSLWPRVYLYILATESSILMAFL